MIPMFDAGDESFPDSRIIPSNIEFVILSVPKIKITYHFNHSGRRCMDGKITSILFINSSQMGTKFFIESIMLSALEKADIIICEQGVSNYCIRQWFYFQLSYRMGVESPNQEQVLFRKNE